LSITFEFPGGFMQISTVYSFIKQLAAKLDEKLAIRILCLFVR
jgi:hypothetical protein